MSEVNSIVTFSEDIASAEAVPPLPKGDYQAEVRGATRKTSATSGNDYAALQMFIPPEQYPADYVDGDPDGTILGYNRITLRDTPADRHRIRKACEALGAPMPGKELDLNSWVGCTATVTVDWQEYEGEQRASITRLVAP